MPLDTSTTYPLTKLRLDGRRWNELRLLQAQISTNPASSGSSFLSMGNTSIMCSVHGPAEGKRGDATGGAAGSAGAVVEVDVNVAGFAGVDRRRRAGGSDRQSSRIATILRSAFQSHLHTHLYPHSTISIHVSVLSADGSLLAAAVNACTLALVDAGIPMPGLLSACTSGMSGSASTPRDPRNDFLDPLLDLSLPEEQELPFLTVGTTTAIPVGEDAMDEDDEDMKVSMMVMDSKVHCTYLETMLAVGIDGCKQIREILEGVIKGTNRGRPSSLAQILRMFWGPKKPSGRNVLNSTRSQTLIGLDCSQVLPSKQQTEAFRAQIMQQRAEYLS